MSRTSSVLSPVNAGPDPPAPSARALACPNGHGPLHPVAVDHHVVQVCRRCGGTWCAPDEWDAEALGPEPMVGDTTPLAPYVVAAGASPLECPHCAQPMCVLRVTGVKDLTIHQCERCAGVWLAHEEWDNLAALQQYDHLEDDIAAPKRRGRWWFQFLSGLPVELNVEPKRPPLVTGAIMILCGIVFVAQQFAPGALRAWVFVPASAWRPDHAATFVTYAFLHAGVAHFVGNLYFLYLTGDNVEDALGHAGFAIFYLLGAVVSAAGFALVYPDSSVPVIGASGAIAALLAAYAVLFRNARLTFMLFFSQRTLSARTWIALWVAFNVLGALAGMIGPRPHTAFVAHLAGFAVGLLVVLPLRRRLVAGNSFLRLAESGRLRSRRYASPESELV